MYLIISQLGWMIHFKNFESKIRISDAAIINFFSANERHKSAKFFLHLKPEFRIFIG
jgi:hypothetical protein